MATLSIGQALIIAIWVAIVMSRGIGYATLTLRFSPLMTGLVVGIVTGHITEAMIITAAIQLVYMGAVAPGGALPSEPAIAGSYCCNSSCIRGFYTGKSSGYRSSSWNTW